MASEGVQAPVRQLPHDEIVQRYESGELVSDLCEGLAEVGFQVSAQEVEAVLDAYGIIRHGVAFEIPEAAPRGFSTRELPKISLRRSREDVDRACLKFLCEQILSFESTEDPQDRVKGISNRESILAALKALQSTPPALPVLTTPTTPAASAAPAVKLSRKKLARLAERHAEGKGVPLRELARQAGVGKSFLAEQLHTHGYVVSSYPAWVKRRMEELKDEIVTRYRDEGQSILDVVIYLKTLGVHAGSYRVRNFLKANEVPLRPAVIPKPPRPPLEPEQSSRSALGKHESRIAGQEAELARRILDCEVTIRQVAQELGVDHNWLGQALRRTGHLPQANLNRLLARRRAELAKNV